MGVGTARTCNNCGEGLVSGDRFCAACGGRVDRACSQCGVMLVSGDRFCPDCGTPQDPTGPAGAGAGMVSPWEAAVRELRSSLAGEYRITRELGRGGQAAVFQADEIALNRIVAIKVLAPGSITGDREVELFRREAQTIANLKHPHIVTIYSVRQVQDLHLFVMQYIEGRSLAAIIADRGQLPLTAVRAIAFQVGSALQYAHRRNVIHRDVKPANVLFDEDGNAILTDFGIAKDAANASSTVTGSLMGTVSYMSPEQCHQATVSWASDQYSLGVLLYEMLTGRVPFVGSSFAVQQGHANQEPPSIRTSRADCPVELEWAVMRMLAKQPVDRWPSIPEALAALGAGPLTRDDPIRGALKRLAKWASPGESALPTRLTLRVPERLEIGESMGCEVYAINGTDTSPQRVTATWRVSDGEIAEFEAANGLLYARKAGTATITADTAQGSAAAAVEVVAATVSDVVFALAKPTMSLGETVRLSADVRDRRGGRLIEEVQWSVMDQSIASVTADGLLSALHVGSTSVVARVGAVSSERTLFVEETNAASIVIRGGRPLLSVGETELFGVDVFDAQNRRLAARDLRWASSNDAIARIDRLGTLRAIAPGAVTISASCGSAIATTMLSVVEPSAAVAPLAPQAPRSAAPELPLHVPAPSAGPSGAPSPGASDTVPAADLDFWLGVQSRADAAGGDGPSKGPPRVGRRLALIGIPLIAVLAAVAVVTQVVAPRARQSADTSRVDARESFVPAAYFSAQTIDALSAEGHAFDKAVFVEDFSSAPRNPNLVVAAGRLTLASGIPSYSLGSWRAPRDAFAVHVDLSADAGGGVREGGLVLVADGGARYFVRFFGPAAPSYSLLRVDATGTMTTIIPSGTLAALRAENAVDVVVFGGILRLFVNGTSVGQASLTDAPPTGQIGVFVGRAGGVSFDNLVATGVSRR